MQKRTLLCSAVSPVCVIFRSIPNSENPSLRNYVEIVQLSRGVLISQGSTFSQEKSTPGSTYFLGNKYRGVLISWEISAGEHLFTRVLFYDDTGIKRNFARARSEEFSKRAELGATLNETV